MPYIVSLYRAGSDAIPKAIVVDDVLWCGVCKPRGEPVEVPELA